MSTEEHVSTYDAVPYPSQPFSQSHPQRLAMLGTLFGMQPPELKSARVLELGCAAGGNLIPVAISWPGTKCVGVDLSPIQIEQGQRTVDALGLENIDLRAGDIASLVDEPEEFDYVICHGVYSWVPPHVQDAILSICREKLSPQGVAYVSYNTYPGWRMRGMVREMMRYHAAGFDEIEEQISQARALLNFLIQANDKEGTTYQKLLSDELTILSRTTDSYLFHEHLEEFNAPVYFYEFVDRAKKAKLRFLSEAEFSTMVSSEFPSETQQTLAKLSSGIVQMEQYTDFLRNRMFRQSLLCHADVTLNRSIGPEEMTAFCVASQLVPPPSANLLNKSEVTFQAEGQLAVTVGEAAHKLAMKRLSESWPQSVPFETLHDHVKLQLRLNSLEADGCREKLGSLLSECFASGVIELTVAQHPFVTEISDRPVACPLARHLAADSVVVTNRRHENIALGAFDHKVITRLDGTRARDELIQEMVEVCLNESLIEREGETVSDADAAMPLVQEAMDQVLDRMASHALLVG